MVSQQTAGGGVWTRLRVRYAILGGVPNTFMDFPSKNPNRFFMKIQKRPPCGSGKKVRVRIIKYTESILHN